MKIEVNQPESSGPWGRLTVADTRLAADRLSGGSFKIWVQLALNQDGFVWSGNLEPRTVRELESHSYLTPLSTGGYLFRPDGEPGDMDARAEWEEVVKLYGSGNRQAYVSIRAKLAAAHLEDQLQDILAYWVRKYPDLRKIDHSKAKNVLTYDFSILMTWWLWDNFRFQAGDILEVGEGAKLLRFHDGRLKCTIQAGVTKRKITEIHMDESTANYWDGVLAERKVEIPLECVAKILESRR